MNNKLGPLMVDIAGYELTAEDKEILEHPAIGGIILFARNFHDVAQVKELNKQIKQIRNKKESPDSTLLIAIDQEGGPVQRIKEPLTVLPSMSEVGRYYEYDSKAAISLAQKLGWLLASELIALGFDFSFTPVVDLNLCDNKIVNLRAFHKKSDIVSELAWAIKKGLNKAGMPAVAKHFPGHGGVEQDSHELTPIDSRDFSELDHHDLVPYKKLIANKIEAIMTSHIIFNNIDNNIVTFSKFWLDEILRDKLGFKGLIVSDDLNMQGANFVSDAKTGARIDLNHAQRVDKALEAGCELILLCNNRSALVSVLDQWNDYNWKHTKEYAKKVDIMRCSAQNSLELSELQQVKQWREAFDEISKITNNVTSKVASV